MTNNIYFGIVLSLASYLFALFVNKLCKGNSLANPMLISILLNIGFLVLFDIPYAHYALGADYISFFIGPVTVALVINLYKNIELLKKNLVPILAGVFAGVLTNAVVVLVLGKVFSLADKELLSIMPKSITTPVGMALSEEYGGYPSLTVITIVITGILGSFIAPLALKLFRIKDPIAKGIAIGSSAHAGGTTKAVEMGEVEGAMSGLAIALTALVTVLVLPIFIQLFIL